ncbi:MAG TPA: ABC transporter permease, partial [Gemmatimonadales bacterium]
MIVSWLARLSRALRALIRPGRSERDLDEELRFHLDMDAADWARRGVPPSHARQAARRAFGPLSPIKEQIRELRLTSPLEHFGRDVRGALRGIRRAPGFALAVIVTLAMGIAAVTTMFSITSGILRELPVEAPDRLVHLAGIDRLRRDEGGRLLAWELLALAGQQRTLETLAAYDDETFHLGDASRFAQRWSGAVITPGVFEVLRVRPALGRTVTVEDGRPGAPPVVILGHTLWTRRYDADPTIVGREIRVNGLPRTVIGVMPDGFRFPVEQDLWTPFAPSASAAPGEGTGWTVFGRLRDGRSLDEARVEFQSLAARLAAASPATHAERTVQARSYRDELVPPRARMIFRVMLLVVSFVLLVACANAANLLLTRAMARRHEVAVRSALGGARYRILTQLLTEVLVLAAIAGL